MCMANAARFALPIPLVNDPTANAVKKIVPDNLKPYADPVGDYARKAIADTGTGSVLTGGINTPDAKKAQKKILGE